MFKRTKTSKVIIMTLAAMMIGGAFIGCGSSSAAGNKTMTTEERIKSDIPSDIKATLDGEKAEGGSITILGGFNSAETINGNPYDTAGPNWDLVPFLYDYLADFDPFPERTFRPSLLESYTFENKVLNMKLKDGLKWSDGTVLDADDVLTNTYMRVGKSSIWKYIDKMEKLSNTEIKITFNSTPDLLLNLFFASSIMAPDHIYGELAKELKEIADKERILDPNTGHYTYSQETMKKVNDINTRTISNKPPISEGVYSGAFRVEKVTSDQAILKANEHYRFKASISEVIVQKPGSGEAGSLARMDGTFDVDGGELTPDQHEQILKKYNDNMRIYYAPIMEQWSIMVNSSKAPLDKPQVRQALSYALDRDVLIGVANPGFWMGDLKNSGVTPSIQKSYTDQSFLDSLTTYDHNVEKADELLKSIGWTKNNENKWVDENGEVARIEFASEGVNLIVEAASQMLNDYGFTVDFKPMDGSTYWEYVNKANHGLAFGQIGNSTTYAHPWESYNDIFKSYPNRIGLTYDKDNGEELILELPSTGEKINVTQTLDELFNATSKEVTKELTEKLMKLGNELSLVIPVGEKSTPIKLYNNNLSVADANQGELLQREFWFGTTPQILNKMLHQDKIWLTKEK